jgi:hypothetical protein
VIGGWRKLHNEELHNLYFPPYSIRTMKLGRMKWVYVERVEKTATDFGKISEGNPEGKEDNGRPSRKC